MTVDIAKNEKTLSYYAELITMYFDLLKRSGNLRFHGVVYRNCINGRNYTVEVKVENDTEADE